ncbi:ankyrin repeat-containing protein 15 [Elsinoe australis]|uniref:Ankyrin repeat-containing protein 15 n=1 Tax=Elsinoe australis TaxID=40998 RepID=A0A4U7AZN9_9PEZI|nr:ankyrin repeat-containing protein 15 [Elsinoe australis]
MEAFGVAASAIQLADIAFRLCQNLADFVNNARTADTAAKELRDKVQSLYNTIDTVKTVINLRDESSNHQPLSDEEKRVRKTLKKDILVCSRVLEQFDVSLKGLLRDPNHPAWLGKTLVQLQLDKRGAVIRRLEAFIDARLQMMQVSLACLNVLMNAINHRHLHDLCFQIGKSQGNIKLLKQVRSSTRSQTGNEAASSAKDSAIDVSELEKVDLMMAEDEENEEKEFRILIAEASEVYRAGSLKAYSEPRSETNSTSTMEAPVDSRSFSPSALPQQLDPIAVASPSVLSLESHDPIRADPTPGFDDTTHIEPLEALIERLSQQAHDDMQRAWYNQAEQHQREAIALLQERHVGHNKPFDSHEEMQTTLADILEYQKKHEAAQSIRHALLRGETDFAPAQALPFKPFTDSFPDPARALKSAVQYHSLARGNHDRYQYNKDHKMDTEHLLEVAERDAKRAFKLRRHFTTISDHTFLSTVELLLKIYDAQEKTIYHDVYWRLYMATGPASSPSMQSVSPRSSFSHRESIRAGTPLRPSTTAISDRNLDLQLEKSRADSAQGGDPLYETYTCVAGAVDDSKIHLDPQAAKIELRRAVRHGDVRSVSTLLERSGQPPALVTLALLDATRRGNHHIVQLLLEKKDAKPDVMDESKQCALHIAAQYGHLNIVQLLLNARANANIAGADGWTAIHFAIHGQQERVLHTLFHNPCKANVDAKNAYGDTGLHAAAEHGEFRLADILLRAGADSSIRNNGELTPLEVAIENRKDHFVKAWLAVPYPCDVDWSKFNGVDNGYVASITPPVCFPPDEALGVLQQLCFQQSVINEEEGVATLF